ncbi:ATP-dependent DNA helicase RecQ [uncultured Cetobacterium sp.]|uniref:RecQ family ATP-dependent DNA helicase n=1 Tax=uncultured Cetobacterium sp. TaxID=527638 RepID=UPI0026385B3F|nr:RecQ family ATP-dependent DNA helicase [uncultured Cetobacterium sp.]
MEDTLQKYFGFTHFREGQKEVIGKILNDKSAIAIFATGSGKSLCYQLPALKLKNITLVVSPLVSLMQDQLDFLNRKNIPAVRIDSSQTRDEFIKAIELAKKNQIKILMISPERFKNEIFRSHLKEIKVDLMVIDEAHSISEWGHNFRPDYLKLPIYKKEFNIKNVLLLTATATPKVIEDMKKEFDILEEDVIITGFYRSNLELNVEGVENYLKDKKLLKELELKKHESTIVYVTQQKTADRLSNFLSSNGFISESYHAGKNSGQRENIQNKFMCGETKIIVATIAFGMGIDKSDIRNVIHYNLPKSLENYAQEIGRAGRDGEKSFCKVLATKEDLAILKNFIYGDFIEKNTLKKFLIDLEKTEGDLFELSEYHASRDYNIKVLPLKTLMVYLEMNNILMPVSYSFKKLQIKFLEQDEIIKNVLESKISKEIVEHFFKSLDRKKVWSYLEVDGFENKDLRIRKSDLTEIIKILEKTEIIEYRVKETYQLFRIINRPSEVELILETIYDLFINNVKKEIERFDKMIDFFESTDCLSMKLSSHFGETNKIQKCGHCSVCKGEPIKIPEIDSKELLELEKLDFEELSYLKDLMGEFWSLIGVIKYLSGINTPKFGNKGNDPYFGKFENIEFNTIYKVLKSKIKK